MQLLVWPQPPTQVAGWVHTAVASNFSTASRDIMQSDSISSPNIHVSGPHSPPSTDPSPLPLHLQRMLSQNPLRQQGDAEEAGCTALYHGTTQAIPR